MKKVKINTGMLYERQEMKFMVPAEKYTQLLDAISPYMQQDEYGLHTINTIYYDTDDYSIIRHCLDKPKFKQKLRLRSYGTPTAEDAVYLELKKKVGGITYKRRMMMTLQHAQNYMENGIVPIESKSDIQTFGEIDWFVNQKPLAAKVLISYDRIALLGREDEDFRMTFDAAVRWRDHHLDLGKGDYGTLLLQPGCRLLEIKTLGSLPLWLCNILSELKIYSQSFSKYGTVYNNYLINADREVSRIA